MKEGKSNPSIPWTRLMTTRVIILSLVACVLLIGYIGTLVGMTYFSQARLRESALVQLKQDTEKRADAVSYFFSERKNDLKDLANSRAISAFFENKALGMSMQYGLRASLLEISKRFDHLLADRKLDKDRIYDRILFIGSNGKLLVDSGLQSAVQEREPDWKKFLTPDSHKAAIIVTHKQKVIRLVISIPYFFKKKYSGQIMAWIRSKAVYHLVEEENKSSKRLVYIACGRCLFPFSADIKHEMPLTSVTGFGNTDSGGIHRLHQINKDGEKQDFIALRVLVEDTPLSLVAILPTSEIFDFMASRYLPLGMGVLAIIILGGIIAIIRINTQKLIFYARLEETSKREQEIQEKNRQLKMEIAIREQAEQELQRARDELEMRVEERTRELAQANAILLQKIEERKRADRATRREKEKFRVLVEESPYGVSLLGKDGHYKYVNPRFVEIFGYTLEDIPTGREWFKKAYPSEQYRKQVISTWVNDLKSKKRSKTWHRIFHVRCKDRTKKIVHFRVATMETGDHLIFYEDITERKRLEGQLQQAQKMESIGTLAGGIAHDFNNILSAIIGYTEIAELELTENSKVTEYLEEVLRAGQRAKDLVGQILAFSRQTEERRNPLQLSSIVKEALKLLRASIPSTIEIRQKIEAETRLVEANPTRIHQVLMNLCTNAYHAMRERGGVLEVTLANVDIDASHQHHPDLNTGPYVRLTVSDTGYGIPDEIMQRIFDPYFTTKSKEEGTGLGLSVVHGIVRAHGGAITVYSEPGKGSTFHVYLPAIERRLAAVPDKATKLLPTGNEHILLVDDELALVGLGKRMLEYLGYKVTTRTSSIEALELFRSHCDRFDMVVTDMTMPNMTGEQLAKEIMTIRTDIPVVLCTGFSETMTAEKARSMGIKAFVMKPFVLDDLAKVIRNVLDMKEQV